MPSEIKNHNSLETRIEHDSMGPMEVPKDAYWGAQTQRSLKYFSIGEEKMPLSFIKAFALQKKVAALANIKLGVLDPGLGKVIAQTAEEILEGKFLDQFPLSIWQTGSGTQTNMNLNEVIANRAVETLGGEKGSKTPVHPNDHVNMSQSTNDSFPTVMHMAVVFETHEHLLPALNLIVQALEAKIRDFSDIIKIGRTHLQDATPLTLGQEFSGYKAQLKADQKRILCALEDVYGLAQGGTTVGTGLNVPKGFSEAFIAILNEITHLPFRSQDNKFAGLASQDELVFFSGTLNTLAVSLFKIANDIRLLGSGPRAGIGELILPENEPGSSIMPGKVNPTQCEALCMIAIQVMGNHSTISMAGSQGHLELNAYKPIIIHNILQSIRLLADGMVNFTEHCLKDLQAHTENIKKHLEDSLMLVTALSPHIGYERSAQIAKLAHEKGTSLKAASLSTGFVSEEQFDSWVRPEHMIGN